uniref:Uncharacterized protein n=1 Tax=viral metagenome TaxID=1070528 RepID=A0A6C0ACZ8_9ZZZZ
MSIVWLKLSKEKRGLDWSIKDSQRGKRGLDWINQRCRMI